MKRDKILLLLMVAAMVVSMAGCGNLMVENPSVWLIVKSTQTAFWQATFAGANAAKSEYNVDLTIKGPDTEEDYQAQNEYIAQAIEAGADAIVLSAISYTGNAEMVEKAIKAGIKVVIIDSDVNSDKVSARIGTDNVEAGRTACNVALATDAPELTVGIINFDAGVRNGQEREAGFRQQLYQNPRVKRIYTIHVLTRAEEAEAQTRTLLEKHPEINVLVSFNEPLTVGAARALGDLGLEDQVRLVGFDTNLECIDMLQENIITALMVQNPYAMGYLGVETAWKVLNGDVPQEGNILYTPAEIVTRETMFTLESQKVLFPFG